MSINNNTPLILPRTLVNKIITYVQQNENRQVCGLISENTHNKLFFYPLSASPSVTTGSDCFKENNTCFSKLQTELTNKGETLLACIISRTEMDKIRAVDNAECLLEQCFCIVISLNTKGVIDMQAYYRNATALQAVELGIL